MRGQTLLVVLVAELSILLFFSTPNVTAAAPQAPIPPLAFGIDRSNMGTQWTLAFPQEPNVSPFLASEYNKPGNFEARRVAVMNGIARLHAAWFRDGFGGSAQAIDLLKLVHARGMKMLAIVGPAASDYPPGAHLDKAQSGCPWGTYPLSKINIGAYRKRIEAALAVVRAAGQTVEAFEIGNEVDLYCNDADNPTGAEWAKHHWKWFLNDAQVRNFVSGYAPLLASSVGRDPQNLPAFADYHLRQFHARLGTADRSIGQGTRPRWQDHRLHQTRRWLWVASLPQFHHHSGHGSGSHQFAAL